MMLGVTLSAFGVSHKDAEGTLLCFLWAAKVKGLSSLFNS